MSVVQEEGEIIGCDAKDCSATIDVRSMYRPAPPWVTIAITDIPNYGPQQQDTRTRHACSRDHAFEVLKHIARNLGTNEPDPDSPEGYWNRTTRDGGRV